MDEDVRAFLNLERLYHFTKFETALKILITGKLKFGVLNRTNDTCEHSKNVYDFAGYGENQKFSQDDIRKEIYRYQQISLTEDIDGLLGFELHQMWGHYANKGFGVCLVFDAGMLKIAAGKAKCDIRRIEYTLDFSSDVYTKITNKSEIRNCIHENRNEIFFKKRKEWEHEQEVRIIKRFNDSKNHYLDIRKSLKYIILFHSESAYRNESALDSFEKRLLEKILSSKITILEYGSAMFEYSLVGDFYQRKMVWREQKELLLNEIQGIDVQ